MAGIESHDDGDSMDLYPERYKLLAVQAYVEEKITEGQLARLLRCSRIEAREIVEMASRISEDDGRSYIPVSLSHSLLKSAESEH